MNVFLDSNILYSDPFFRDNFARNFLETMKTIDGKIFISNIVYQEMINNYKRELKKRRKSYGEAFFSLNKLLFTKVEHTFKNDECYTEELCAFYQKLIDEKLVIIIPHTEFDMFDEIVERSLNNTKPFDHQKEEFKDTVIWLTYAKFVEEHETTGYFLSNNTKEFYASDNKSLHPDLLADTQRLEPYKSIEDFLTINSDNIKELLREIEEERSFIQLLDWAENNISESYVESMIKEKFLDDLHLELSHYIDELSEMEINSLLNYTDFISKIESIMLLQASLITYEREIYGSEIIIYGSLDVNHFVSLYIWNSFRDKGENPYYNIGSDTIIQTVKFTFSIDSNYKAGNFEVKEIENVNGTFNEPSKVNPEELF